MANARSVFLAVIKGDASQAVTEFNKLGQTVEKSTGKSATAIGKFKTLGSAAMAEIGMNAQTMAVTAGVAFAKFAADGANQLAKLAKASDDFSKATGFSIEQSSEWIEVSGDLGVSAETLQGVIGRLNKNLATDKFEKYGIATRDAAGNMLSSQDIFLNVLDAMNRTPDAGKRAKMGADLMGKGWQGLAPILGKSRDEYEQLLASVSEGQRITAAERRETQKFIEVQQELADTVANYQLEVGKSGVSIIRFGDLVMNAVEKIDVFGRVASKFGIPAASFSQALNLMINPLKKYELIFNPILDLFEEDVPEAAGLTLDALIGIGNEGPGGISMVVDNVNELARAAGIAAWEVQGISDRFADLIGLIDERQALRNVADQFDDVAQAAEDYYTAVAEGSDDAEALQRDYLRALDELRLKGLDYMTMLGEIPPYKATEFLALIDQGKYDEAKALLDGLAVGRVVGFRPVLTTDGAGGLLGGQFVLREDDIPGRAIGGPVSGGMPYMVGERGPELFVPGMSGSIVPNHALGGGGITLNVTVTNPVASGEQLANELAAYTRRNGSRWLVPT